MDENRHRPRWPLAQDSKIRSRTIIDTQFTHILCTGQFGGATLCSDYIYQLYAYLRSQATHADPLSLTAAGMLLHPPVRGEVDEAATIQGRQIRFVTADLDTDSLRIKSRLFELALGADSGEGHAENTTCPL